MWSFFMILELITMVIVLCMICKILHDHLLWFFTHLTSWSCRGQSWGLVWSQDGLTWKAYQCSWPFFWNHEDNLTLDWVIQIPKKGLRFGRKSAKKHTVSCLWEMGGCLGGWCIRILVSTLSLSENLHKIWVSLRDLWPFILWDLGPKFENKQNKKSWKLL